MEVLHNNCMKFSVVRLFKLTCMQICLYLINVVSFCRCQAIYRTFHWPHGLSKTEALRNICLIWVFVLLITVPWAVIFDVIISFWIMKFIRHIFTIWYHYNHLCIIQMTFTWSTFFILNSDPSFFISVHTVIP